MWWPLIVVLICIYVVKNSAGHPFMLSLAIHISSFLTCPNILLSFYSTVCLFGINL